MQISRHQTLTKHKTPYDLAMSKPDLPEKSVEEFRRALGNEAGRWNRDKNGVFHCEEGVKARAERISFPSRIYENEFVYLDSFWVYCRAKLITQMLQKYKVNTIWEFGAGDGRVSIPISQAGISLVASEPHYEGARTLAKHNIFVCNASLTELELKDQTLSTVGIFDVLEHIEDSTNFLKEINRAMKPGSLLFLTVPSHQWLFSEHDIALGHHRRYSRRYLKEELNLAGFKPLEVRYFFASLILPALLMRRIPYLLKRQKSVSIESSGKLVTEGGIEPHPLVNNVLKKILSLDSKFRLPFGLSLLGVFKKV
jgi:2-polyprenyl-3-methyl-5-hydroxy-6-metoxy-1,4-benzoquinol methylase